MGIMDKMRAGTDSFFIQAVFVIIIVSFVFWGVGNQGPTSSVVAYVNGERITDTAFNRLFRRVLRNQQATLSDEQTRVLRGQVLDSLIEKEVMLQEAARLGLAISPDEVNRDIYKTESFKGSDGKFSMEIYERILTRSGISRVAYEQEVYERLLLDRLRDLAVDAVHVSDIELEQRYVEENTRLTLSVVAINDMALLSDVEVPQADVDALVAAEPERIKAAYDAQFDRRFSVPRKALISTILLRTDIGEADKEAVKAQLEAIAADLRPDESFEEVAKKWSEDLSAVTGGNLGNQTEDQLDPVVAEAVFAAGAGAVTPVIETNRGFQVLWVREVTEAQVTSLEDASPMLAQEILQAERAPEKADEFAEQALAQWKAEGAAPMTLLASRGLIPQPLSDLTLANPQLGPLGPAPSVFAALADTKTGEVLPEVYDVNGQRVIVQVNSRLDADMGAFEDDSALLRQRMVYMEQMEFVQAWRDSLIAAAEVERLI